jgi:hypothetical protein
MQLEAIYPTPEHQAAAETIVEFWTTHFNLDAVLLVNLLTTSGFENRWRRF